LSYYSFLFVSLGWLSEEQKQLNEKRMSGSGGGDAVSPAAFKRIGNDDTTLTDDGAAHRRGSTLSMFTGGLLGTTSNDSSPSNSNTNQTGSGRRSSLMAITSMFKKEKHSGPALLIDGDNTSGLPPPSVSGGVSGKEDQFFSSPFTPPPDGESEGRLPTAMRLHCLRCKGTVEGPKFSTCKCSTPALTPDELSSDRLSSLTGMLRGSIFKSSNSGASSSSVHNTPSSGEISL
jgi:hypothetical protein